MLVCFGMVRVSLTTSEKKRKFQNRPRMYAIGLYEFFGGILGTLVHRGRARQCDQRRAIF